MWVKRYGTSGNSNYEEGRFIKVGNSGVYVGGIRSEVTSDYFIIKYDFSGNELWTAIRDLDSNIDVMYGMEIDNNENIYLTGQTGPFGHSKIVTLKYDKFGSEQWVSIYNGIPTTLGFFDNVSTQLVLDNQNNVYITGTSNGITTGSDFVTLKYNNLGAFQWDIRYGETLPGFDKAYSLSVDNNKNVYTIGGSLNDIVTVKYSQPTGISLNNSNIPSVFELSQNYPNPFNPTTNIKFKNKLAGIVKLSIFDLAGKEVALLVNERLSPGEYEYTFDGSNLTSGVYFYQLKTEEYIETKRMILAK